MNFVKELSNKTVSISEFNRGLAGRIFDDVKANGSKVVLKNNTPECILISPDEYTKLIDELEDARDLMLANARISSMDKSNLISQDEFEKSFNINLDEVSPLDEDEIE
ncbi:type II toxin-antitoxin system Phd/YefM family antitoxin [Peptoniphilus sp. SGI.035]|uniref:type II toxin-antitoxin system Phd/YefM family antitoxin n=1 Tax=Peptoniphilus sp. SGI.035 TaxID=3420564 RepID=UPI003D04D2D9